MRAKAKRMTVWAVGLALLFGAGLMLGGSRPAASAQTEVLVQGRYILIDKSDETNARHYIIFDTQNGILREWSDRPDSEVYTYEFDAPKEIKLSTTVVRR